MAWDESSGAKIIPNCILWMRGLVPIWVLRHSFLFIKTASDYVTSSWRLAGGTLSAPFWCLCQKLSLSPLHFNKTLLHKSAERSSLVSGPGLNSSPPEAKNPASYHSATTFQYYPGVLVAQLVRNLPAMWQTQVQSLGGEDPLEKEMTMHFSILPGKS